MNSEIFGTLIDSAHRTARANIDAYGDSLRQALLPLSSDELSAFDTLFDQKLSRAYQWNLWGAAYLINDGCSDDGFVYFRAWLIMQGRDVYEKALTNPDSLADICREPDEEIECEDVLYVAGELFEEKTGTEMEPRSAGHSETNEPVGEKWEEDDLPALLPRLAQIHIQE
jgi:hypothetical protein